METVEACLTIHMYVTCPNDKCANYIDLLDPTDTDDRHHDEEGMLLRQMFPSNGENSDFECEEVRCTNCKQIFNVKGLEW